MRPLKKLFEEGALDLTRTISHPPCPTPDMVLPPCSAKDIAPPACSAEDAAPLWPQHGYHSISLLRLGRHYVTLLYFGHHTTLLLHEDIALPPWSAENVAVPPCSAEDIAPSPHFTVYICHDIAKVVQNYTSHHPQHVTFSITLTLNSTNI